MENKVFEVKINSTENNKDRGFEILTQSGSTLICLEDEKYVINESTFKLLKEEGIIYELISVNGELVKDATTDKN